MYAIVTGLSAQCLPVKRVWSHEYSKNCFERSDHPRMSDILWRTSFGQEGSSSYPSVAPWILMASATARLNPWDVYPDPICVSIRFTSAAWTGRSGKLPLVRTSSTTVAMDLQKFLFLSKLVTRVVSGMLFLRSCGTLRLGGKTVGCRAVMLLILAPTLPTKSDILHYLALVMIASASFEAGSDFTGGTDFAAHPPDLIVGFSSYSFVHPSAGSIWIWEARSRIVEI